MSFTKDDKTCPITDALQQYPEWKSAHKLTICLKVQRACDSSSLQKSVLWSVSSALSWLYQIVPSEVQYLAHKLPKVPRANWADVSNCLGGRLCVRVAEIEKQKKKEAGGEKQVNWSLFSRNKEIRQSPVCACMNGLEFYWEDTFFMTTRNWLWRFNSEHQCSIVVLH